MTRISNKGGSGLPGWQLKREDLPHLALKGCSLVAVVIPKLLKGLDVSGAAAIL